MPRTPDDRALRDGLERPDREQTAAGADPAGADAGQTGAGADPAGADSGHSGADSGQRGGGRDHAAADLDQRTADHHQDLRDTRPVARAARRYEETRQGNDATIRAREETAHRTATAREATALARDATAQERDVAAAHRDRTAEALDREIETVERFRGRTDTRLRTGADILLRAARDRTHAQADRQQATERRLAAGHDRELAALDREQAALDREQAGRERALASLDELTGTMRRGAGLAALQREMDRAQRTDEPLVAAFVDVDGLKAVNDGDGHASGDDILRRVADAMRTHLRPYDLIVRVGGDEFLCAASDADAGDLRRRLEAVNDDLAATAPATAVTVGMTEYQRSESLQDLISRADTALLTARGVSRPGRR